VYVLRQGLSSIDECNAHGHYTKPIWVHDKSSESEDEEENSKSKEDDDKICDSDDDNKLYYELAGHPLPCYDENSKCQSSLRVLRAAATHFPELRKLKRIVYEAKREDFKVESIDTALCAGDFEKLCKLCGMLHYKDLFSTEQTSDSCCDSNCNIEVPLRLQEPKLPDLESNMHVEHAALIAEIEKKFADDAEFPCCCCERLLQRKQVTAFAFSDTKFSSNMSGV